MLSHEFLGLFPGRGVQSRLPVPSHAAGSGGAGRPGQPLPCSGYKGVLRDTPRGKVPWTKASRDTDPCERLGRRWLKQYHPHQGPNDYEQQRFVSPSDNGPEALAPPDSREACWSRPALQDSSRNLVCVVGLAFPLASAHPSEG